MNRILLHRYQFPVVTAAVRPDCAQPATAGAIARENYFIFRRQNMVPWLVPAASITHVPHHALAAMKVAVALRRRARGVLGLCQPATARSRLVTPGTSAMMTTRVAEAVVATAAAGQQNNDSPSRVHRAAGIRRPRGYYSYTPPSLAAARALHTGTGQRDRAPNKRHLPLELAPPRQHPPVLASLDHVPVMGKHIHKIETFLKLSHPPLKMCEQVLPQCLSQVRRLAVLCDALRYSHGVRGAGFASRGVVGVSNRARLPWE